jgi:hypothetical protein
LLGVDELIPILDSVLDELEQLIEGCMSCELDLVLRSSVVDIVGNVVGLILEDVNADEPGPVFED